MGKQGATVPSDPSSFDWGNIDQPKFEQQQLQQMKHTCRRHCFSTLQPQPRLLLQRARVIKWVRKQAVTNRMKGGARSSRTDRSEDGYRSLNESETVEFDLLKGPKGFQAGNVVRA
jgi:'Cold-shock' DNA-binding domain